MNVEYDQGSRGFAFRESASRRKGLTLPLLTVIHILINAVFALAVTYLLSKYHKNLNQVKGKKYQVVASIYWSVVFLCFLGAAVIIAGNVYLYYALVLFENDSEEAFGFRLTNDITVATLVLIEFIASVFTPIDPDFFIPHLIRRTLCCNQCCSCCGSPTGRRFLRRAILSVAMWVIILLLQLVMASILPFAIVAVRNPVPSLAFFSILVAMFFCLVVFFAYFLNAFEGNYIATHKLSKKERRRSSLSLETLRRRPSVAGDWARNKLVLIAQAFIFLVIFGIVSLAIIIYLNFVRAGANANTLSGLFFSLVPSVALGGIAWVAKRHLFREFDDEVNESSESSEEEVKQSLIQIGQFSIGSKTRRSFRKTTKNKTNTASTAQLLPDTSSEHGTENNHQPPATTLEIDMPGPADSDTASGGGQEEKNEQMLEITEVGKEDEEERIEIKEDGDAEFNMHSPPTIESNDCPDLGTSQMKRISFATDELSVFVVPNTSHD